MSMHHTGIEVKPTFRMEFDPTNLKGQELFDKIVSIRDNFNKEFNRIKDQLNVTAEQPSNFTISVTFDRNLNTRRMIDFMYSEKNNSWKMWFYDGSQPQGVSKWCRKTSKFEGKIINYVVGFVDHRMMP